jgi:hypothetical protein
MTRTWAGATAISIVIAWAGAPTTMAGALGGQGRSECLSLMMPEVHGVPGNAEEASSGVRDLMSKYLAGPSFKLVPLESRLPSQAAAEAKEKACEPILVTSLTRKSGGGRLTRALGQAAGASSWYMPGGGTAASAAARVGAQAGLQTAASLAASTKAKDEMTLEYRLQSAAGDVRFGPKTETQKASIDGEDLITPIVTRMAEAVVAREEK